MTDIADVSVAQARQRWESMRRPRFAATFAALDCYKEPLSKAFPPEKLAKPFDVVSMQFCMHYAFETAEKARCMLQNVGQWLRKGGVFVGTIPNADYLMYAYIVTSLHFIDRLMPTAGNVSMRWHPLRLTHRSVTQCTTFDLRIGDLDHCSATGITSG